MSLYARSAAGARYFIGDEEGPEGTFADPIFTIDQGVHDQSSTNQFLIERVVACGKVKDNPVFETFKFPLVAKSAI